MFNDIIKLSQLYGNDPELVLAGGGNTSYKAKNVINVKASGVALSNIDGSGFVALDMNKLLTITKKQYPIDDTKAEAEVLIDTMNARLPGENKRPSVEALLHALFKQKFVVHLHPAIINGITCTLEGLHILESLFGDEFVWIKEIKPGYTLAMEAKYALDEYFKKHNVHAKLMFLQNHGVFFAADTVEDMHDLVNTVISKVDSLVEGLFPNLSETNCNRTFAAKMAPIIRSLAAEDLYTLFSSPKELHIFLNKSVPNQGYYFGNTSFTPDHIVYCGHKYCYVSYREDLEEQATLLSEAISDYEEKYSVKPKIICIENIGMYACGDSYKEALTATELFHDVIKIYTFAKYLGTPRYLSDQMISFILAWEVESYRKSVSLSKEMSRRLENKIVVITGGAQGFGEGLAKACCEQGANVVIADINMVAATSLCEELNNHYGNGTAKTIECDVSDEKMVKELCDYVSLSFGGIDIFISNAGILRSGGLDEMDTATFEKMTIINYTAFYFCCKYASKIMKLQQRYSPKKYFDIVQVNSKSGLEGSKNNFAYAGGKFGGIGLVQSFALELVSFNIKVNAICPGNYFEGPLWNDPTNGLFVQYLHSGKVPGAKTILDVKRHYESKVPMMRGCTIKDIAAALFYIVEQEYETGQALPITGGQVMMR